MNFKMDKIACRLPYFASDRWWLQLKRQRRTSVILVRVCPKVVGEQAVLDDEVDTVGERIEAAVRADAGVGFNRKNFRFGFRLKQWLEIPF